MERIVICRCEDITEDEVLAAIHNGATTMEELKRVLRVGMGPCQGRTCGPLIRSMLARELGEPVHAIREWSRRPPLKPVPAGTFFRGEES